MNRKLVLSLLCSLSIIMLIGCNKQKTIETESEVLQPKELITKIDINSESLIPEIEEVVSNNSVEEVETEDTNSEETITYEKVTNYHSFPNISVLQISSMNNENNSDYVYLNDMDLTTLLNELSNDYIYVFDKVKETDLTVYENLYQVAKNSSSTDDIFFLQEELNLNNQDNTELESENLESESEENLNEEVENLEPEETTDEIENIENQDQLVSGYDKYAFTLYKAESVSIYNQDKELIIKNATSANDLSFILGNE